MAKTWKEKLHSKNPPKVEVLDKPMMGLSAGTRLYISTPLIVKAEIDGIPVGETRSILDLREQLARKNDAEATCPLTTGIFVRIVAEDAYQEMQEGKTRTEVSPFWRVIDPKSPLAKKFSGGPSVIADLRASEGIG